MEAGTATDASRYAPSRLAAFEQAIALVRELRELDFSPHTIMFELRHHHGFTNADADRVVHEAVALDPQAEHDAAPGPTGVRSGRRWPDVSRVTPDARPTPRRH